MGDQPNYGQPMQPQSAGAKWGPTSMGMEAHIAAGLGYFFSPILPLIFFLIEKNNRFVKFHAMQSILLGAAYVVFFVVVFIIQSVVLIGSTAADNGTGAIAAGGGLIGCLISCLYLVGALGFLGLVIWGMVAGFTGKYTKLPIVGNLAEKWSGGPVQPAY